MEKYNNVCILQPQHPENRGAIEKLNRIYLKKIPPELLEASKVVYTSGKKYEGHTFISAPSLKVVHMLLFFVGVWQLWSFIYRHKLVEYLRKNNIKNVIVSHSASHYLLSKKMHKEFNFIFVQHTGVRNYLFKDIPIIGNLLFFLMRGKKRISMMHEHIFFTENDKKSFDKWFDIHNYIINPNFIIMQNDPAIKWSKREKSFIFFGRFDELDKNISQTFSFLTKNNLDCDWYGNGSKRLMKMVSEGDRQKVKGFTRKSGETINSKYKFNILISNPILEGYSLATLEAMAAGTIPVVNKRDSLYSFASELVSKNLAIPYDEFIDNGNDLEEMSSNCIEFVRKNNSVEKYIANLLKYYN